MLILIGKCVMFMLIGKCVIAVAVAFALLAIVNYAGFRTGFRRGYILGRAAAWEEAGKEMEAYKRSRLSVRH